MSNFLDLTTGLPTLWAKIKAIIPQPESDENVTSVLEQITNSGDEALSAETLASVEDEIVDTRVGADGTTYPTAGDAVRGQISGLKEDLNNTFDSIYNGNLIPLFSGTQPVNLSNYSVGQIVDLTPISNAGTQHYTLLVRDVAENDIFYINLTDGTDARPWAFLDSDNRLLSVASSATATKTTLTAPANAEKLLLQCGSIHFASANVVRELSLQNLNRVVKIQRDGFLALNMNDIIQGSFDRYGNVVSNSSRIRNNGFIQVFAGQAIHFIPGDVVVQCLYGTFTTEKVYVNDSEFVTGERVIQIKNDGYLIAVFANSDKTAISSTDFDATFEIYEKWVASDLSNNENIKSIYQGDYLSRFSTSDSAKFTNLSVGDVLDLSPLNNAGQHKTLLLDDVAEGESFYINITDGTDSKPWAFLDGNNKILSMADGAEAIDLTIVAPSEAKKLLLQIGLIHYNNAVCIRYGSFDYYDRSTDVKKLNEYTEYKNKLENASNIYGGDTSTPVKSRANLLNLIHFSDIHGNVQNIRRILEFSSMYTDYISDIIHTGDAPVAYYSDNNPFAVVGGDNVLEVIGNHECWIQGDTWPSPYNATAQQVYQKFFAPYIASWGVVSAGTNLCYYYKDYSTAKVRLIVLDALHYDLSQETWFVNTLESARTANLRVVAVTHYPSQTGLAGINCTFNSITQTIGSVATPPAGTQIERMPESAFDAVDTFIANGGEFVCWLSGHTHEDFIGTVNNHTDQIQVIISCADTSNRYSDCARTKNTKSQDLFNVFTVDTESKLIKIIRVGSTMDKFLRKREMLCVNYNTKAVVSNS